MARLIAAQDAADGLTDEDAVPEIQERPVSLTGDLCILGEHKLLMCDATESVAVEKLMGVESADLVFTDPHSTSITRDTPKIA